MGMKEDKRRGRNGEETVRKERERERERDRDREYSGRYSERKILWGQNARIKGKRKGRGINGDKL